MPALSSPHGIPGLVSVLVLNKDQRDYLQRCIESVLRQSYLQKEIVVIDNASTDGSQAMMRAQFPHVHFLPLERNVGYAGGHNRGLQVARGAYVLLLNADLLLEPSFIEEMVQVIERASDIGMVQGKLYQMTGSQLPATSRRFDSVGLLMHRNRRTLLRGYGELDQGQYERGEEIFAPDGAAPLYRREMLEDIRLGEQYFDEAFFMYREEVDLGRRARWRGWRAWYAPQAIAWHVRRYAPGQRWRQAWWLRRLQWRNRYCLLVKNDAASNVVRDLLPIMWFEVRAFFYSLIVEPHCLAAYVQAARLTPLMWRQRQRIFTRRTVSSEAMRRWFV